MKQKTKFKQTEIGEIPEDWGISKAEEYCERVTDGTHDSPKQKESGKPLITSRHLKGDSLDFENAYLISQEDYEEINKRSRVDRWDVIVSMIGTIGETYLERNEKIDYAIKNVGLFKSGSEIKGKWLFYWMHSPMAKEYTRSHKSGTTQEYVTLGSLREFPIACPDDENESVRITAFLEAITAQIRILQQQNETLEAMGKALFKHWFVDFEFPNEKGNPYKASGGAMVDSELGEIPKGWEVGTLNDIAINLREVVDPSEMNIETYYIGLEHMPRKSISLTEWGISENIGSSKFKFRRGQILFGKLRPYFYKVGISPIDGMCSTDILVIEPKKAEWLGNVLFTISNDNFIKFVDVGSTGTKMPRTDWEYMKKYDLIIPPKEVAFLFSNQVTFILNKIIVNIHEMKQLRMIRDSLLPKLMTGKIRVPVEVKA